MTEVQEFENGALLGGRHIVTYDGGEATGGSLKGMSDFVYKSDVRDSFNATGDIGALRRIAIESGEAYYIKSWGKDNQAPLRLDESIRSNQILPSLLDTKRKIILGQRPYMFYERWEKDAKGRTKRIIDEEMMPPEIEDFFLESDENRYFQTAAGQLVKNGNPITEFLPTTSAAISKQVISALRAHEAKFWRKEEIDPDGTIQNAFFKGDAWARNGTSNGRSKGFPIKSVQMWQGESDTDLEKPFIYWTGDSMFCPDDYYYSPIFLGALPWGGLMNVIPLFHDNRLKHGYFTPLHIRIRKGMFLDKRGYEQAIGDAAKKKFLDAETEARTKWLKDANNVLTGYQNSGRVIWSEEEVLSGLQKQFPDVEFIPIKQDLYDEAYDTLNEAAIKAVISSVQMHPTLANVQTEGKLSSGSEMQHALDAQRIIHTPLPRQTLLEPVYIAARLNGWNKAYAQEGRRPCFGFMDEEMVVKSEDKSGVKPTDPNGATG